MILYGAHSSEIGGYPLGSSLGLKGLRMAITLAWRQLFGSFEHRMQVDKNLLSHSVAFLP